MGNEPTFDVVAAHRYFAANCFNLAWDLIEKADRSEEENRMMVELAFASICHWRSREGCSDTKMSIGYWQASRVHSLVGNADEAKRLAKICLGYSQNSEAFYQGFAYEALARAEGVAGNTAKAAEYLAAAREQAAMVAKDDERAMLEADLDQLAAR